VTHISTARALSTSQRALLLGLFLALFVFSTGAIYFGLTSRAEIVVWDFHTPWLGLRAMLYDGASPYSDAVTLAIQQQRYGRVAYPHEDQLAFAYPLYIMALIGPLALFPLPVAQAIWLGLLLSSLLIFVFVAPRAVGWHPRTWLLALTAVFALGLYPNVWAIILGQVSIVVATLVALAWWGLRAHRWGWAGICLALATIKPQMTFLIVPALLIWAIHQGHWRLVIAFAASLGVLIVLPLPWLPDWPVEWLAATGRYAGYTIFDPPLVVLIGSAWLAGMVGVLLLAWTLYAWWRAPQRDGIAFDWALAMIVVVTALIAPRTSQANQLVLLLPLFFVFARLSRPWSIAAIEIGLLFGLWLIDLTLLPHTDAAQHTLWEHRFISPILPFGLALALLTFSPRAGRVRGAP